MTIDEQISFLTKGAVDVIRNEDLRNKLERSEKNGKPLRVKYGADRPRRTFISSRGRHPQIEDVSGFRTHGNFSDRRFHRNDRRPVGQINDAPDAFPRRNPGERGNLQNADFQIIRPGKTEIRLIPNG
jgi:hypothetical protein